MNSISEKLKYLRDLKKLTQKEVANSIGVTTSAYGFYEQGKRTPSPELIVKLAEYFNVTTDYLLGHTKTSYSVNANIPEVPSIICEDNSNYDIIDEEKDIESLEDMNKLLKNTDCNNEVKEVLRKYMQLNEFDRKAIERMIDNAYERLKEDD
ncbi:helix-turn-helix domain-containing protein [Clostridioides difficile]|uniref:helix-turn-helix domain-containing protein n=1 Tax=Clostridioides difficile TaxID=1496 RepID=UPI00038D446A|nr:helix-turn-helix transcriptional regulator [Clostridioides difficile]MDC0804039.1 helix-turn-helix transcriptional regulator [Clostridium paraputrificum]EQJ88624.1 helix-turn-helix family protein [Clostridioides difficile P50]MBN6006998.1 helix-turn-helix transcriptional regulator [Clostridioides difficile]MCE4883972.1 helix-turn-helix domain-containing protein [Clostridioides difficile]MCM3859957.1 helix-turn-helix domain-containing protein [Clostridioides difficile]